LALGKTYSKGSAICQSAWCFQQLQNTVKKINDFPVPSRDVTKQTFSGRE
jgi:hypothetical protein